MQSSSQKSFESHLFHKNALPFFCGVVPAVGFTGKEKSPSLDPKTKDFTGAAAA